MKYAVIVIVLLWLLCGVVGAGMLGDLDAHHWKRIARGPITLAQAVNDNPVSVPGTSD